MEQKERLSEAVPRAERVGARQSGPFCGGLVPCADLAGAVGGLAWSEISPEILSKYVGVEGNSAYCPSSPSPLVNRLHLRGEASTVKLTG